MTSTIEGIRDLIVDKLETLEESGESIFGEVFGYPEGEFGSYPAAVVRPTGGSGNVRDTHRNERIFVIEIGLWQEVSEGGKTKQEASDKMISSSDAILIAFDQDKDLGGEVQIVNVVNWGFDFSTAAGAREYATFVLEVRVLVPSYTPA